MTFPITSLPFSHTSNLFSLAVRHSKTKSYITMQVKTRAVNTHDIPQTYSLLDKQLPSIFKSRCFNDDKLPFAVEVLSTEIGHLFEHVLLEYLCELKLDQGCDHAVYQGVTSWNWIQEEKGSFHITIGAGMRDAAIFGKAMQQTISLVDSLMQTIAFDPTIGLPLIPNTYTLGETNQQISQVIN